MSRNAYSLNTLVRQVKEHDPDAEITLGEPDGLDVIREASFDKKTSKWLADLFSIELDERIALIYEIAGVVTVTVQPGSVLADQAHDFEVLGIDVAAAESGDEYDPGEHTVVEVLDHLDDVSPEEVDRIKAAEAGGKDRTSIANYEPSDTDTTD